MTEKELRELESCRNDKKDCGACCKGKCIALQDTRFKGSQCPFYKPKNIKQRDDRVALVSYKKKYGFEYIPEEGGKDTDILKSIKKGKRIKKTRHAVICEDYV